MASLIIMNAKYQYSTELKNSTKLTKFKSFKKN